MTDQVTEDNKSEETYNMEGFNWGGEDLCEGITIDEMCSKL